MRPWNRYEPSRCGEVRRMQLLLLLLLYVCGSLGKKANRGSGNSHVISLYKPGRKNVSSSRIWIVRVSQQNVSQAANCSRQLEQLGWTHVLRFRLAITKHFVRHGQDHLRSTDVPTYHSVSFVSYIPTYRYNGAVWQRFPLNRRGQYMQGRGRSKLTVISTAEFLRAAEAAGAVVRVMCV